MPNRGLLLATLAFLAWGLFPIYWKQVGFVEPLELLFWRLFFTALFLLPFAFKRISFTQLACCFGLGALISLNWGAFIWAISNGYLLQSSLAYFLAPLLSVFLGAFVLKEQLSPLVKIALFLAMTATLLKVFASAEPIYAALVMASSFGIYGLFKKLQTVKPLQALCLESIFGTFLLIAYLGYFPNIGKYTLNESIWISFAGPVTIFPLILFAYATKLIRLQSVGFLNYLVPIAHLLLAVYLYDEKFTNMDGLCFSMISIAVLLFLVSSRKTASTLPYSAAKLKPSN